MPTTENRKLSFTPEQYDIARNRSSALEYAQGRGYELVRDGGTSYHMKDHDSMVFTQSGRWFWNSRGLRGGAIEFIMQYEYKSLVEAVLTLSGDLVNTASYSSPKGSSPPYQPKKQEEKAAFLLPEKAKDSKRLYGYLLGERKLDSQIISDLVKERKIYLSETHKNAVFVGYDMSTGIAKSAFQRGTFSYTNNPFKGDVAGSDKSYPFFMSGNKEITITKIAVFEASIDAISHATIQKLQGLDYKDRHRISIGGLGNMAALNRILEDFPFISEIEICFDNDVDGLEQKTGLPCNHGQVAAGKWLETYLDMGYAVTICSPAGKDFNTDLKQLALEKAAIKQQNEERKGYFEEDEELELEA